MNWHPPRPHSFVVILAVSALTPLICCGQAPVSLTAEEQVVQAAGTVLNEAMNAPGNQIPQSMLQDAHGVAIIPNVLKGSFIVGARHGRGLLFVREPDGIWHAPVFVTMTGGNVGWQIGVQSSDIVLVFKTARSIQGLLSGKLTLGADAAAAAGPVGREAAVATDGKLSAEIYTYSRSRGLFAGVSIDGSVVQVDSIANSTYYRVPAPGQPVLVPVAAGQLTLVIANYAGNGAINTVPQVNPGLASQSSSHESEVLRNQLTQIAPQLYRLLDPQWTDYLALPAEMFRGADPDAATLQLTIERFDNVHRNPQFAELTARPEFQSIDGLLRHYQQSLNANSGELKLPPPPVR